MGFAEQDIAQQLEEAEELEKRPPPPGGKMLYAYTHWQDAPLLHQRIYLYAAQGCSPEEIHHMLHGVSLPVIRKVLRHPPITQKLAMMAKAKSIQVKENLTALDDMMAVGFRRMKDNIDGDKLKPKELLSYMTFVADRHPDGMFVKQNKTQVQSTHTFVTPQILERMMARAADMGCHEAQRMVELKQVENEAMEAEEEELVSGNAWGGYVDDDTDPFAD